MREYGTALVQEPVAAELDTGFDDPAEGAEVVVCDVGDEEGVIHV